MRFTNFTSSCLGKLFVVLLCVLLGIVLTLGAIIGGGYLALTRQGMMGTIQDFANKQGLDIEFIDDIRDISILDWGKELLPALTSISTTPFGRLDELLGMEFFSLQLSEMTGLDIGIIQQTTFEDFGETIAANMTVLNATEKFGVALPDLPAFNKESFLDAPLSTAFSQIDDFEINDFVEVDDTSSPLLQSIADLKIGELSDPSDGLDARINALPLKEVITITEDGEAKSNIILIQLKDTLVGDLGSTETNDFIMSMELQEVIELEEGTVLWELRETPLNELGSNSTNEQIKNMKIADLIDDIDENSSPILQYFVANDITLSGTDEFGNPNGVDYAMKVMTLKDMMPITQDDSIKLLWALRDCPLQTIPADDDNDEVLGIEDTLKITPLKDLLEIGDTYIWEYLGEATVMNIGVLVDDMRVADAIEITGDSPPILRKMRKAEGDEDPTLFGDEDLKINDLSTQLEPLILDLELSEILTITSSSEPILIALMNVKIKDMNTAIQDLKVNQIFRQEIYSTGALALISPDTNISQISNAMTTATKTARIQSLINVGIIDDANFAVIKDKEVEAQLRNSTVDAVIGSYIQIINNVWDGTPLNTTQSLRQRQTWLDDYTNDVIDMAFLNTLKNDGVFQEGYTLILDRDTTIAAEDFHTIFSVMTNGYTLTIEDGATIRSAEYDPITNEYTNDRGGYIILSNDVYGSINQGGTINGSFAIPDDVPLPGKVQIRILPD